VHFGMIIMVQIWYAWEAKCPAYVQDIFMTFVDICNTAD